MNISESLVQKAESIFLRYPPEHREAALIPVMFEAQREFGCITPEAERWVADIVGVSLVKVREVLTFYSMFRTTPVGKYHIQFCHNIACCLAGAEDLQAHIEKKLGIRNGETTTDGMFTLSYVECLGGCAWAPMMIVNEEQYYQLTPARLDQIIDGFRAGKPVMADQPTPLRGNVGEKAGQ
ncbi:MAG TPA: NAD(P)H-dependent oxidoreductase subunit E [bacterium]|jgi:NADH-quinone oxidoreductase E subunit